MALEDIPFKVPAGEELARRDAQALKNAEPPAFRFERAQLRLEVALKNGLGEREALRLQQLAEPLPPNAEWRRRLQRAWVSTRARLAIGALATAAAATVVWTTHDTTPSQLATTELAAETEDYRYQFEDGSWIELSPGTSGHLSTNDDEVHFDLLRGLADFDVVPQRSRTWRVTAGEYEVVVIGTHFSVRVEPVLGFEVQVERGVVAVRIPEQKTPLQLEAGSRLEATQGEVTLYHDAVGAQVRSAFADLPSTENPAEAKDTADVEADDSPEPGRTASIDATRAVKAKASARSQDVPSEARELRLLRRARRAIAAGEYQSAMTWLSTHRQRFPKGQLAEEREALRVEALRGLGRAQEARRAAGEFRERFPKSVLSPQMPTGDQ